MRLLVFDSHEELSRAAADAIADEIRRRPDLLMLAATGRTPERAYQHLAQQVRSGGLDVSQMRVAQLDEYVGVGREDERSLVGWMQRILVDPLRIDPQRVIGFGDIDDDASTACREYGRALQASGVDLSVLGLGPNGHLGFNEPPSEASSPTRLIELAPASVASNAHYWGSSSRVPTRAVTVGLDVILASRTILLLVSGPAKVGILKLMLESPASADNPASLLRLARNVTVLVDRQAYPWRNGEVALTKDIEMPTESLVDAERANSDGE